MAESESPAKRKCCGDGNTGGSCWCWQLESTLTWSKWRSNHPDEQQRSRQYTEWIEFKNDLEQGSPTRMTQGVIKLQPNGMLPIHHHPEPYAETYYIISGNGHVNLSKTKVTVKIAADAQTEQVAIEPSLHVEIPACTIHGIDAMSEGCESAWTFGNAPKWSAIPYLYVNHALPNRNVQPERTLVESWTDLSLITKREVHKQGPVRGDIDTGTSFFACCAF
jgi:mannose-6-phosphate isomerase-like protein (cupin superfamily)